MANTTSIVNNVLRGAAGGFQLGRGITEGRQRDKIFEQQQSDREEKRLFSDVMGSIQAHGGDYNAAFASPQGAKALTQFLQKADPKLKANLESNPGWEGATLMKGEDGNFVYMLRNKDTGAYAPVTRDRSHGGEVMRFSPDEVAAAVAGAANRHGLTNDLDIAQQLDSLVGAANGQRFRDMGATGASLDVKEKPKGIGNVEAVRTGKKTVAEVANNDGDGARVKITPNGVTLGASFVNQDGQEEEEEEEVVFVQKEDSDDKPVEVEQNVIQMPNGQALSVETLDENPNARQPFVEGTQSSPQAQVDAVLDEYIAAQPPEIQYVFEKGLARPADLYRMEQGVEQGTVSHHEFNQYRNALTAAANQQKGEDSFNAGDVLGWLKTRASSASQDMADLYNRALSGSGNGFTSGLPRADEQQAEQNRFALTNAVDTAGDTATSSDGVRALLPFGLGGLSEIADGNVEPTARGFGQALRTGFDEASDAVSAGVDVAGRGYQAVADTANEVASGFAGEDAKILPDYTPASVDKHLSDEKLPASITTDAQKIEEAGQKITADIKKQTPEKRVETDEKALTQIASSQPRQGGKPNSKTAYSIYRLEQSGVLPKGTLAYYTDTGNVSIEAGRQAVQEMTARTNYLKARRDYAKTVADIGQKEADRLSDAFETNLENSAVSFVENMSTNRGTMRFLDDTGLDGKEYAVAVLRTAATPTNVLAVTNGRTSDPMQMTPSEMALFTREVSIKAAEKWKESSGDSWFGLFKGNNRVTTGNFSDIDLTRNQTQDAQ